MVRVYFLKTMGKKWIKTMGDNSNQCKCFLFEKI